MSRGYYEQFRNTPEGQRLLQTIRFAEGTAGADGYNTMFTGAKFNDLSKHPRLINSSNGLSSDAAGAYQFLSTTYEPLAASLGLDDFSPINQDIAALALADQRLQGLGGLGVITSDGMSKRVADALAPEWASFPTAATGTSYYGQGGKSLGELQAVYGGQYQNMGSSALAGVTLPGSSEQRMAGEKIIRQVEPEKHSSIFGPVFAKLRSLGIGR